MAERWYQNVLNIVFRYKKGSSLVRQVPSQIPSRVPLVDKLLAILS